MGFVEHKGNVQITILNSIQETVPVESKVKVSAGPQKYSIAHVCMFVCALWYKTRKWFFSVAELFIVPQGGL